MISIDDDIFLNENLEVNGVKWQRRSLSVRKMKILGNQENGENNVALSKGQS